MSGLPLLDLGVLDRYPRPDEDSVGSELRIALGTLDRKIVVLDDDPTGVQTVHGIHVYTQWSEEAIEEAFAEDRAMFFILTNSRGLAREETARLHAEIATNLQTVSARAGRPYLLVSRSDSTLRGHFPLETETLRATIESLSGRRFDGEIIMPFFKEGGRFTIDDVHYVREGSKLVPAGQTEFAADKTFGYQSSNLRDWVEEKTGGAFTGPSCVSISLEELRSRSVDAIAAKLRDVHEFAKVIVNAIDYIDVEVFTLALTQALRSGREFMFRSAAALTKVLGGIPDRPLLSAKELLGGRGRGGGIILIGSHVNKTTRQFEALKTLGERLEFIEFNQHLVIRAGGLEEEVERVVALCEARITEGLSVVVYTRRDRFDLDGHDEEAQLAVSLRISDAVTSVIGKLAVRPAFIIAKGGITSSDVGTKALGVRKALVMGQIRPGVPVWLTGEESKFPGMAYVIFPGNVGEIDTLKEIVEELISA